MPANPITPEALERMEEVARAPDWPATFDTPVILSLIASARRAAELEAALEVAKEALEEATSKLSADYGPADGSDDDLRLWSDEDACRVHRKLDSALTTIRQAMGSGS